jgi:peptidoglycan/LPS O-acetylase OafA/YrhL
VSIFFVISGFYITLVLNGKYGAWQPFIAARLLRLFPAYLVSVLIAHLLVPIAFGDLPLWPRVYFLLSNIAMIGSELTAIIIRIPGGGFGFMPLGGSWSPETSTWHLLYNGPVWSLSVEMMFYALAPFVVRIDRGYLLRVALMIAASLGCHALLYAAGARHVPWDYNFFPPNLYVFMLGSLSFYLFATKKLQAIVPFGSRTAAGMLAVLVVFTFVYRALPGRLSLAVYIALVVAFMPYVFEWLKASRIDRFIGDLSYPLYIMHFVVLTRMPFLQGYDPVLASVAVATVTYFIVMLPVERLVRFRITERPPALA